MSEDTVVAEVVSTVILFDPNDPLCWGLAAHMINALICAEELDPEDDLLAGAGSIVVETKYNAYCIVSSKKHIQYIDTLEPTFFEKLSAWIREKGYDEFFEESSAQTKGLLACTCQNFAQTMISRREAF